MIPKDYADEPAEDQEGDFLIGLWHGMLVSSIFWLALFVWFF